LQGKGDRVDLPENGVVAPRCSIAGRYETGSDVVEHTGASSGTERLSNMFNGIEEKCLRHAYLSTDHPTIPFRGGMVMDVNRAKQIVESPKTIEVRYRGKPVWIQHVNDDGTARVYEQQDPEREMTVSVGELQER
jgi:small acid-soluble spore protein H (minor)